MSYSAFIKDKLWNVWLDNAGHPSTLQVASSAHG